MRYYDVSVPIAEDMITWPTDPAVRLTSFKAISRGDHSNVLKVELGSHTGSHVDSPSHFGLKGTMDDVPLKELIGPATVVQVKSKDLVRAADIARVDFAKVRRVLFKTRNSKRMGDGKFHSDYVALSIEVARALRRHGVRVVGIDAMSVGDGEVHRLLLRARIVVIENVDLSKVPAGKYDLICLPLKLAGADGAPARVVLVRK